MKKYPFLRLLASQISCDILGIVTALLPFKLLLLFVQPDEAILFPFKEVEYLYIGIFLFVILVVAHVYIAKQKKWRQKTYHQIFDRCSEYFEVAQLSICNQFTKKILNETVSFFSSLFVCCIIVVFLLFTEPVFALYIFAVTFAYFLIRINRSTFIQNPIPDILSFNHEFRFYVLVFMLALFLVLSFTGFTITLVSGIIIYVLSLQYIKNLFKLSNIIFNDDKLMWRNFHQQQNLKAEELNSYSFETFFPTCLDGKKQIAWFDRILTDKIGSDFGRVTNCVWKYIGYPKLNCFFVEVRAKKGNQKIYIVNVYDNNAINIYNRERTFLRRYEINQLALPNIDKSTETLDSVVVYDATNHISIGAKIAETPKSYFLSQQKNILIALWSFKPIMASEMQGQDYFFYLNPERLAVLVAIANEEKDDANLRSFLDYLPLLKSRLSNLPKVFLNPYISPYTTFFDLNGNPKVTFWGHASVAPIGCQLWYVDQKFTVDYAGMIFELRKKRKDCFDLSENDLKLASYTYGLMQEHKRKKFHVALSYIELIVRLLELEASK